MLLAVGFQGWLGKKVVDANLAAVKVTIHMIVALIIAALPVVIISKLRYDKVITSKALKRLALCYIVAGSRADHTWNCWSGTNR